jgi:hypothetical protein
MKKFIRPLNPPRGKLMTVYYFFCSKGLKGSIPACRQAGVQKVYLIR